MDHTENHIFYCCYLKITRLNCEKVVLFLDCLYLSHWSFSSPYVSRRQKIPFRGAIQTPFHWSWLGVKKKTRISQENIESSVSVGWKHRILRRLNSQCELKTGLVLHFTRKSALQSMNWSFSVYDTVPAHCIWSCARSLIILSDDVLLNAM